MNGKYWKLPILGIALLPFLLKTPYLLTVWRQSPLDRYDGIFFLLAIALAALTFKRLRGFAGKADLLCLLPLLGSLAVLAGATIKHVQTAQAAGTLLLLFSVFGLLWGRRLFIAAAPIFAITLLGCPSTSYWVDYFLRNIPFLGILSGVGTKLLIAALFSAWALLAKKPLQTHAFIFLSALGLLALLLLWQGAPPQYGDPLLTQTGKIRIGNYLAYKRPITPLDQRFFGDNTAERFLFIDDQGLSIELLAVKVTGSIHSTHPAGLCLKSGGHSVLSSREISFAAEAGTLACLELFAQIKEQEFLFYVWYVGNGHSTGNFLSFRRAWAPDAEWYAYQIIVPVPQGDRLLAEKRLRSFLDLLLKK